MRPRQVIEAQIETALESNTTRDEAGEPTQIRVPILDMCLVALEVLIDIRDIAMLALQATGKIRAVTGSGIELPNK